jgi:hypothetical protein
MNRSIHRHSYALLAIAIVLTAVQRAHCDEPHPLPWVEGSATLAVLPDTEVHTRRYPQ